MYNCSFSMIEFYAAFILYRILKLTNEPLVDSYKASYVATSEIVSLIDH